MRHSRGGSPVLALAGSLLLASALGASVREGFDRPSPLERLEPGATVVASWTLAPGALRDLDEAELVLSIDGGVTFPVRLTGRILPDDRSIAWRVPSLPTEHARVALRAGREERAGAEEILFVSEMFAIAPPGRFRREDLFAVNDEWRTREALEGAPARSPSSNCQSPGPESAIDPREDADAAAEDAGTDGAHLADGATGRHDRIPTFRPSAASGRQSIPPAPGGAAAPLRL